MNASSNRVCVCGHPFRDHFSAIGDCSHPRCACKEPTDAIPTRMCGVCGGELVIDDTSGVVYCVANPDHPRRSGRRDATPNSAAVSDDQREAILELVGLISASAPLSFENAQRATAQIIEIVEGEDA